METPKGLCIPPIQSSREDSQQGDVRQRRSCTSSPNMAGLAMVAPSSQPAWATTSSPAIVTKTSDKPDGSSSDSPDRSSTSPRRVPYLQQRYQAQGLSDNVCDIFLYYLLETVLFLQLKGFDTTVLKMMCKLEDDKKRATCSRYLMEVSWPYLILYLWRI